MAEPVIRAVEDSRGRHPPGVRTILLSPQGRPFRQEVARDLAAAPGGFVLVSGRYEGIDERARLVLSPEEISLGDFVLSGGEVAAMAVLDAAARLVPGVLGHERSAEEDSFSTAEGLLDHPHYTRPPVVRGLEVPAILRSGDHGAIARWRQEQALLGTRERRPDLLREAGAREGGDPPGEGTLFTGIVTHRGLLLRVEETPAGRRLVLRPDACAPLRAPRREPRRGRGLPHGGRPPPGGALLRRGPGDPPEDHARGPAGRGPGEPGGRAPLRRRDGGALGPGTRGGDGRGRGPRAPGRGRAPDRPPRPRPPPRRDPQGLRGPGRGLAHRGRGLAGARGPPGARRALPRVPDPPHPRGDRARRGAGGHAAERGARRARAARGAPRAEDPRAPAPGVGGSAAPSGGGPGGAP